MLLNTITDFVITWTPRTIVATVSSYYSLGIAYDIGLMADLDRIAIRIFKYSSGYTGIGAFMPTFQWYAAWTIRVVTGMIATTLYDLIIKVGKHAHKIYKNYTSQPPSNLITKEEVHGGS